MKLSCNRVKTPHSFRYYFIALEGQENLDWQKAPCTGADYMEISTFSDRDSILAEYFERLCHEV